MSWISEIDLSLVLVFSLVLTRVSGLITSAPIAGTQQVPIQVRVLLVMALALLITPSQWTINPPEPKNLVDYALLLGGELLVGLILGLGLQFLFSGVQLAGLMISQTSGLTLADAFNPELNTEIPLFSQLMHLVAVVIFVCLGGQRELMAALLSTFRELPLGSVATIPSAGDLLLQLMSESFTLGIKIAAPCVVAILLTTLVMGLISRTLPQLNVMSFGFGANSLVTLAMLSISISAILWCLQEEITPWIASLVEGLEFSLS